MRCVVVAALTSARRHVTTPAPAQFLLSPGTRAFAPDSAVFLLPKLPRGGGGRSTGARPGGIWRSRAQEAARRARPPSAATAVWDLGAGRAGRGARVRARGPAGRWTPEFPTVLF